MIKLKQAIETGDRDMFRDMLIKIGDQSLEDKARPIFKFFLAIQSLIKVEKGFVREPSEEDRIEE